eukprot:14115338-Alexandrium_andersonii.AAC.1
MSASLVGSEMCIRDRVVAMTALEMATLVILMMTVLVLVMLVVKMVMDWCCLLYTSDAADDM